MRAAEKLELLVLGRQEGGVDSLRLGLEAAAQLAAGKMDAKDMEVVVAVKRAYADRISQKDPKTSLHLYGEVGKLATALWKETGAIEHIQMALNVQMQASRAYRAMADPERAYGICKMLLAQPMKRCGEIPECASAVRCLWTLH